MGSKSLGIYTEIIGALNISTDRYEYIKSYIASMISDYEGNIPDIIKEIPLNLKGNERFLAIFIVGHGSFRIFAAANLEQKKEFIERILEVTGLSPERGESIMHMIEDMILKDIEKYEPLSNAEIIKKIASSDFTNAEKDYILFMLGMIYTQRQ